MSSRKPRKWSASWNKKDRESRLILASAKIVIAEEKKQIRADARRRLSTITERRPATLFRQWLNRKVAEGDIPAINALTVIRQIGLSRATEILQNSYAKIQTKDRDIERQTTKIPDEPKKDHYRTPCRRTERLFGCNAAP